MYAIVDIAGQQFKVEKDIKIFVNRLQAEEGEELSFDKVLLIDENGSVKVGSPYVEGFAVTAKVLTHAKADKIIVFKKKRRKGYDKKTGHRQHLTQLQILDIAKGAKAKVVVKESVEAPKVAETKKVETPKVEAAKVEPKVKAAPKAATKPAAKSATKATTKEAPKAKAAPKSAAASKTAKKTKE